MNEANSSVYHTVSPVLFIIFNRPDTAQRVFDKIREARPSRLYVAADGPRADRPAEAGRCEEARAIIKQVDWPCDVKRLFRDSNLGCKNAVSSAIGWYFEQEEEGIILEDDCLPANDFFRYCDTMLERYRYDTRIRHIGGCNLQQGKKWGTASYYFSNMTHVWGWAGWRRVWKEYDKELSRYNSNEVRPYLETIFGDRFIVDTWEEIFNYMKNDKIDTWDYQLAFMNFFNNSLSTMPNVNLISNIGFGEDSTHTTDANSLNANIPLGTLGEITHPLYVLPQKGADHFTMRYDFNIEARWKKYNHPRYKAKRWFKGLLK